MSKYTRTQITQLSSNESTAIQQINKNFTDIQEAIQDCISRSGQAPSHLTSDLDLNGNSIINAPAPKTDRDFVRRVDVVEDISLIRSLVNSATTASAQAIKAAVGVQDSIADNNVGVVGDDLILGDESNIRKASSNLDVISVVSQDIDNVSAVGKNIESVKSVSENESNINAVNENKENIIICAGNINAILDAPNQAESVRVGAESARLSAESAASSASVSNPPPLLTHAWSDHLLNDIRYLRADTFSWQNGEFYKAAYEHLVEDYEKVKVTNYYCWGTDMYTKSERPNIGDILYKADGSEWFGPAMVATVADDYSYIASTTGPALLDRTSENDIINTPIETIGSHKITYYQAEDGHKIVLPDMEATVQAIYNETGVAWYYILDVVNKRFKLPRTKWGFTGLRDEVGKYVEAGLPNATGHTHYAVNSGYSGGDGVFSNGGQSSVGYGGSGSYNTFRDYFDLSRGGKDPVYGKSDTVQPPATQMYLYFYVGNYTRSAIEQTAGVTTEVLNGKLDIDLGNATTQTKETIVGWGIPDGSSGISISGTYTAPVNGLVIIRTYGNGKYCSGSCGGISYSVGGNYSNYHEDDTFACPLAKGQKCSMSGSYTASFYPFFGG